MSLPACGCVSVCLCVRQSRACPRDNSSTVQARLTKVGLEMKNTLIRALLFSRAIDLDIQRQIELKIHKLPHFELVRATSHLQLKSVFPNLDQNCILALLMPILILGLIDLDLKLNFQSQTCFFLPNLHLLFICVGLYISSETIASECSTFHMVPHIYGFLYARGQGRAMDLETV